MSKEEIKALARALAREQSNPEYMSFVDKIEELETKEEHLLFRETLRKEMEIHLSEMEEKHNKFLNEIKRKWENIRKAGTEERKFCAIEGIIDFSIIGEA